MPVCYKKKEIILLISSTFLKRKVCKLRSVNKLTILLINFYASESKKKAYQVLLFLELIFTYFTFIMVSYGISTHYTYKHVIFWLCAFIFMQEFKLNYFFKSFSHIIQGTYFKNIPITENRTLNAEA